MGMFDWYEPVPALPCAACGEPLDGWQGYDGPCLLLVWRQGARHPVAHRVDVEVRHDAVALARCELPEVFAFGTWCPQGHHNQAAGRLVAGVWAETTRG